jgi:hypothetical protein
VIEAQMVQFCSYRLDLLGYDPASQAAYECSIHLRPAPTTSSDK